LVSKSCTAAGNSLIGFPFKLIACAGIISKNIDGSKGQEKPSSKKVLKEQNKIMILKSPLLIMILTSQKLKLSQNHLAQ